MCLGCSGVMNGPKKIKKQKATPGLLTFMGHHQLKALWSLQRVHYFNVALFVLN